MKGCESSSLLDDFLIREIRLTHDPDGRQLDSELLLRLVENVFCSTLSDVMVLLLRNAINLC